ncbi:TPA: hypothetical protein GF860_03535 [Citrobacter koseri]|nr:hypothetical protein [Citrobacter koseri]
MKSKIVIVSDDIYYLTGISKGMKESGTRVESIFLSDAAEFERFTLTTSFSLSKDTVVLLSVREPGLLDRLITFFFSKVTLCISPSGLHSRRHFFCQYGVYYFNKNKTLSELNDILIAISNRKNTESNTITDKEFFILSELVRAGNVKRMYSAINISEKTVSYYKRSALKKMGLLSSQNYLCIHPALSAVKTIQRH